MRPGEEQVGSILPLLIILTSLLPAVVIFFLREDQVRARTTVNLAGAVAKVGLVALLIGPVAAGERWTWSYELLPGIDLVLRSDPLGLYFLALSAVLWLLTTIYAIGYLEQTPGRSRFFGFFSLCVAATTGVALAGNLLTLLIFYELLTLVTYPLVVHGRSEGALRGARTYLAHTLPGGVVLLLGVVWLTALVGPVPFSASGSERVARLVDEQPVVAATIFALLVAGFGVKAALLPLHGWLPRAMVAPAPVSALLHAVAVVKAGVVGIVRVVHDVYGVEVAHALGVLTPLAVLACVTILYGSVQALRQESLKARLAYSTVSQVSYVVLGASLLSLDATTGGLVHITHQGLMKITLFFCAGLLAEVLGITRVGQLAGAGRRMPLTCAAFTVGALGMIGVPPVAGFVSKWYLGVGALEAGQGWVLAVLVTSALLNAAYFLPLVHALWWGDPEPAAAREVPERRRRRRLEAPASLLVPAVVTAVLSVAVGLFANTPFAPLELSRIIAERSYAP